MNGYGKAPDQPKPDPKPNPSKNPKYKVGTPVTYTGLWTQANGGNWYPRRLLAVKEGIITRIIKGAEHPYLINDGTGWTNDRAIDDEPTRPSGY